MGTNRAITLKNIILTLPNPTMNFEKNNENEIYQYDYMIRQGAES